LLRCLASVKDSSLVRLHFSTLFPFCQIGKDGKWANFAVDLRLPLKAWGVDCKGIDCKIDWIFGDLALKGFIFGQFPPHSPNEQNVKFCCSCQFQLLTQGVDGNYLQPLLCANLRCSYSHQLQRLPLAPSGWWPPLMAGPKVKSHQVASKKGLGAGRAAPLQRV